VIKRLFDIFLSLVGILLLSPLLIGIALWVKYDSSGPILFIQKRVGLYGKVIGVCKFRTMVLDAESKGLKITVGNDPRITRSGSFLREHKLDELAQLFNVLSGSMSFVGPRPEVQEYINVYPDEIRDRVLSVRPGITDLASIEFRNEGELLSNSLDPNKSYIEEILPIKQAYYLRYITERSLFLDIKIIFKTILAVFK
jgi:lipopolysaccharide/colanic/teichoic acid biosynthesis glycosyltransferase